MIRSKLVFIPLCALFACATPRPPSELVDARAAYAHAEMSAASKLVPADLHVARESLDVAEQSFDKHPDSEDTKDNAYIALRKAQRAEALGDAAMSMQNKIAADQAAGRTKDQILANTDAKLKNKDAELRTTETALAHEHDSLEQQKQQTQAERDARMAAEKKAQDAMDALSKSLAVKTEARGMVITLSGGVVFATNQATILPGAQTQLNQVADALKTQAEHHFIVEGHTDNQGTDAINDDLSTRRANAVRDYLVVHGVSADAITATGYGSHRPVGDNKSPEGRAMNRRVEIIVDKPAS